MTRLLFLDIDGVLNDHSRHPNGYSGLQARPVAILNKLLAEIPEMQLVISSAWRYLVYNGQMTTAGLESLFMTHGLDCKGRVHGLTDTDENAGGFDGNQTQDEWYAWITHNGARVRREQIKAAVAGKSPICYAVVDDLALDMPRLVQTDSNVGLTEEQAGRIKQLLHDQVTLAEALGLSAPGGDGLPNKVKLYFPRNSR